MSDGLHGIFYEMLMNLPVKYEKNGRTFYKNPNTGKFIPTPIKIKRNESRK